jgi:hypothetical protein
MQGFGQTTLMSSQEIIFAPAGLEPGMAAEILLWRETAVTQLCDPRSQADDEVAR